MLLEETLHDLRERRGVTQTAIAEHVATSRPNVARIERESDVRLSTPARYAEAVGGQLHVEVVFPDESVDIIGAVRPPEPIVPRTMESADRPGRARPLREDR